MNMKLGLLSVIVVAVGCCLGVCAQDGGERYCFDKYAYAGALNGRTAVEVAFELSWNGTAAGYIYYPNSPAPAPIALVGEACDVTLVYPENDNFYQVHLKEYQPDGTVTGVVDIAYTEVEGDWYFVRGTWTNPETGKRMPMEGVSEVLEMPSWYPGTPVALMRPSRKQYTFRPTPIMGREGNRVESVSVDLCVDEEPTGQRFVHEFESNMEVTEPQYITWVREDDINFDGNPDLMIFIGDRGIISMDNDQFEGYVWNPLTASFRHVDDFYKITEPDLDPVNKVITSFYRVATNQFELSTYRWVNGDIKCVKTEPVDPFGDDDGETQPEAQVTSQVLVKGNYGDVPFELALQVDDNCICAGYFKDPVREYAPMLAVGTWEEYPSYDDDGNYNNIYIRLYDGQGRVMGWMLVHLRADSEAGLRFTDGQFVATGDDEPTLLTDVTTDIVMPGWFSKSALLSDNYDGIASHYSYILNGDDVYGEMFITRDGSGGFSFRVDDNNEDGTYGNMSSAKGRPAVLQGNKMRYENANDCGYILNATFFKRFVVLITEQTPSDNCPPINGTFIKIQ